MGKANIRFISTAQDDVADFSTRGGFRSAGAAGGEAIKCFRCNGLNHYARDCLASAPAPSTAATASTTKACYNCGETGHVRFPLCRSRHMLTRPKFAKDCTEATDVAADVQSSSSKACYACSQFGHVSLWFGLGPLTG